MFVVSELRTSKSISNELHFLYCEMWYYIYYKYALQITLFIELRYVQYFFLQLVFFLNMQILTTQINKTRSKLFSFFIIFFFYNCLELVLLSVYPFLLQILIFFSKRVELGWNDFIHEMTTSPLRIHSKVRAIMSNSAKTTAITHLPFVYSLHDSQFQCACLKGQRP